MSLRAVDLFCGCGGMSLGFQQSGIEIVAAYDNWDPAIEVYRKNFKHSIYKKNLSDDDVVELIKTHKPDIILGGPPCQDFSSAGKRDETLGRAKLTKSYCNIINGVRPNFFVMENVPNIAKSPIFEEILDHFEEIGYGISTNVVNASYCNVPQSRKRMIVIGALNEKNGFIDHVLKKKLTKNPMTMRDYFGESLNTEYYFRIPRSYSRRAIFSIDEPSPTIRGVERPIPPNYKKHPNDPVDIGPQVRSLTPIERAHVQTFPESFVFSGSKTDMNQMIGNAVPVNMAKLIAEAILDYTNNTYSLNRWQ